MSGRLPIFSLFIVSTLLFLTAFGGKNEKGKYSSITNPVNGVVGTISYKIGSLVSSYTAEPLTTVSNIGNIYAYFSFNEKQVLEFSRNTRGATTK